MPFNLFTQKENRADHLQRRWKARFSNRPSLHTHFVDSYNFVFMKQRVCTLPIAWGKMGQ